MARSYFRRHNRFSRAAATRGLGFSSFSVPDYFREDQFLVNVDYVINSKHTLSERFFNDRLPAIKQFNTEATIGVVPGSPASVTYYDHNASLKLTSVITNNFVNEARVGFTSNVDKSFGLNIPNAASVGMVPVDPLFPEPGFFNISRIFGEL